MSREAIARGCLLATLGVAVLLVALLWLGTSLDPTFSDIGSPDPTAYDPAPPSVGCTVCEGGATVPEGATLTADRLATAARMAVADHVDSAWSHPLQGACALSVCVELSTSKSTSAGARVVETATVAASASPRSTRVEVRDRRAGLRVAAGSGCVDKMAFAPLAPASDSGALATRIAEQLVALPEER